MKFFRHLDKIALVVAGSVSTLVFMDASQEIGAPMTAGFEGTVLENYYDSVGVETWCTGETLVGYREDGEYTKEECDAIWKARYPQYSAKVYACYSSEMKNHVTAGMHAGLTDISYNTGATCNTGMMRALKRGEPVEACKYMLKYKYAGGRDCSIRSNNCYGVWTRRKAFYEICIKEARELENSR